MRKCANWLASYLDYSSGQESPEIFHFWVGISIIANTLRRKTWFNLGYFDIFPNLYNILVSPTGIGEKSSAITVGEPLFYAIPGIMLARGKLTEAFLADWLRIAQANDIDKNGTACISMVISEFKVLTEGINKDNTLVTRLTDLYDGKYFEYDTKTKGIYHIPKPCLNIMAASTPEWLRVGGGFDSRLTIIAVTQEERKFAFPVVTPHQEEVRANLMEDLIEIDKLKGPFSIEPAAHQAYEKWYDVKETTKISEDVRLAGYYSKKKTMVMKIAMILAVADREASDAGLVIRHNHIRGALERLRGLEDSMIFAYSGVSLSTGPSRYMDLVAQKIKDYSPLEHYRLLRMVQSYTCGKELGTILSSLEAMELVRREIITTQTKPRVVWNWVGEEGGGLGQ